ncbi:inositol phosphorylceramide synthase [Tumebacillus sp. ITR2]|uniref:Inositol phosphorylceramide synthase n=1 Tax=Tumebacillus amylolyticus TaxID=2801339 RepID=A0ABS1J9D0_9BACL|nr:phosphatase PAP2 family protein [Tumebacillus amylolyticus]MBL0386780.1 inositol phosphorylceramide synthase [Tumebacillus amylolyticus]
MKTCGWVRKLELYEVIGILVSLLCVIGFFALGDEIDAKQGEPGWHWVPLSWIWAIYRDFIPKALGYALLGLGLLGWFRESRREKSSWKVAWKPGLKWGVGQTLRVARFGLPFCVLLIIYRALDFYIPLFSPIDRDGWLLHIDAWMFGVQPSIWLEPLIRPWLTDYLSFVYMIWFPMIFFTLLLMMLKSRQAVSGYVAAALFAFYVGYVSYTIVPAIGPLYSLADTYTTSLSGGGITEMQRAVVTSQQDMNISRDCFPSLHTAISCVMLYFVWTYRRKWMWLYGPLVVSILISTVYLRYHYVIDVIAGIGLATLTCWLGRRGTAWWQERFHEPATLPLRQTGTEVAS